MAAPAPAPGPATGPAPAQAGTLIVKQVVNVFEHPVLINVGIGRNFISFLPEGIGHRPAFGHWEILLEAGWRFRFTPGVGYCGMWALLMGIESALGARGIAFNLDQTWTNLNDYFYTSNYWNDAYEMMAHSDQPPDTEDYTERINFTIQQLTIFANRVGEILGSDSKIQITIIVMRQKRDGAPEHEVTWTRNRPSGSDTREVLVFLHHHGNHWQAFTRRPRAINENENDRTMTGYHPPELPKPKPKKKTSSSDPQRPTVRKPKQSHKALPRDAMFLWVTGERHINPLTGANVTVVHPMTTKRLQEICGIEDPSVVRHEKMKARKEFNMPSEDTLLAKEEPAKTTRATGRKRRNDQQSPGEDEEELGSDRKRRRADKKTSSDKTAEAELQDHSHEQSPEASVVRESLGIAGSTLLRSENVSDDMHTLTSSQRAALQATMSAILPANMYGSGHGLGIPQVLTTSQRDSLLTGLADMLSAFGPRAVQSTVQHPTTEEHQSQGDAAPKDPSLLNNAGSSSSMSPRKVFTRANDRDPTPTADQNERNFSKEQPAVDHQYPQIDTGVIDPRLLELPTSSAPQGFIQAEESHGQTSGAVLQADRAGSFERELREWILASEITPDRQLPEDQAIPSTLNAELESSPGRSSEDCWIPGDDEIEN